MKRTLLSIALLSTVGLAGAGERTVTLAVPTMDCPVCPITVKKALTRVDGVARVEVSFDQRRAVVTYDDSKTTPEALAKATREAGYPATIGTLR